MLGGIVVFVVDAQHDRDVFALGGRRDENFALLGPTLRALQSLNLLGHCIEQGFAYSNFVVRRPTDGEVIRTVALPPPARARSSRSSRYHASAVSSHLGSSLCGGRGIDQNSIPASQKVATAATAVEGQRLPTARAAFMTSSWEPTAPNLKSETLFLGGRAKARSSPVNRFGVPPCHGRQMSPSLNISFGGPNQPGYNPVSETGDVCLPR